ncbi:MAG: glycosyltransferase family 39 protein [Flavobacteriales bacterium]|nr:glycosyltransferase family 39 protein [Flavobacteriales bacterium]
MALPLLLLGYALLPAAWWLHRNARSNAAVAVLVASAFLLRLGPSLDSELHEWDERYHALVAKHLIHEPLEPKLYADANTPHTAGSWAHGHIWLNKPPLSLWCIATSLKCFGHHPWAVRVPSAVLGSLALFLLYGLGRSLFNERVAFWAALLFAINGHLIELASGRTSNDHPDTFLLCLVLASLFAAERMARLSSLPSAMLSGVLLGLAFLSKSWPSLIVLPVALAWLVGYRPGSAGRAALLLIALVTSAVLIALPWTLYVQHAFPTVAEAASASHWQHFTHDLEEHGRPWYYYWAQLPMLHGELVPLAILLFLAGPFRKDPARHAPVVLWWLVPYLVFSLAVTKMPAYVVIAVPAICLMAGVMIEHWWQQGLGSFSMIAARTGVVLLVLLPLRFSLDRTAPLGRNSPRYTIPGTWSQVEPRTVVTNCPWPIELMFYTPVVAAYEHDLSPDQKAELIANGYAVRSFQE